MPDKDVPVDGAFVGHATRVTFEGCSVSFVGQAEPGNAFGECACDWGMGRVVCNRCSSMHAASQCGDTVYTVDAEQLDVAWKLCYTAGALSTNETSPFFGIGLLLCVFR